MDSRILEIQGWMAPEELEWLHKIGQRLPEGSIGVELGSWFGRSSAALFLGGGNGKSIVSVDTWQGNGDDPGTEIAKTVDVCAAYIDNMVNLGIDIKLYHKGLVGPQFIQMDALDAAPLFDDGTLRFLFLDDDHTRPGKALDVWLPKMAPDSLVAGHDYFCFWEYIQPQVHEKLHHIHQICGSIWIRFWNTGDKPPTWYEG